MLTAVNRSSHADSDERHFEHRKNKKQKRKKIK